MKKSSRKAVASKADDFVHSKLGSLAKLVGTFKNRSIAARFGSRISKVCQPDAQTREFLLRLFSIAARDGAGKQLFESHEFNLSILRFLLKDDFTENEVPHLAQFLCNYSSTRHVSDLYEEEINELFSLPDRRLIMFFNMLLNHEMRGLRESALELLDVSWNRKRLQTWIVSRVEEYLRDHPDRSATEDDHLDVLTRQFSVKRKATTKKSR